MATFSVAVGGTTRIAGHKQGEAYVVEGLLDFASKTFNGGAGAAQNDVIELVNVPAQTVVLGVHAEVRAGEVSANLASFNVGDGVDPDGWHATLDATAAVNAYSGHGIGTPAFGAAGGKFYAAADTIDITVVTAATIVTGVIKLAVFMVPFLRRPLNAV